MSEDPKIQPLLEWNRLARENTENAIVSSMFKAASYAIEPVEKFSTWLLVVTAAIASFLITNSDKIVPYLSKKGFLVCGGFLCLSCLFGLLAKLAALRSQIANHINDAVVSTFKEHLDMYEQEEQRIRKGAITCGVNLQTGVRLERIISEFLKPLPWWVKLWTRWKLKSQMDNPQIGSLPFINSLTWLNYFVLGQSLAVLAFLISGFLYIAMA